MMRASSSQLQSQVGSSCLQYASIFFEFSLKTDFSWQTADGKKYKKWKMTPYPLYDNMATLLDGTIATSTGAFCAGPAAVLMMIVDGSDSEGSIDIEDQDLPEPSTQGNKNMSGEDCEVLDSVVFLSDIANVYCHRLHLHIYLDLNPPNDILLHLPPYFHESTAIQTRTLRLQMLSHQLSLNLAPNFKVTHQSDRNEQSSSSRMKGNSVMKMKLPLPSCLLTRLPMPTLFSV
jgi:hypothetical protein